MTAGCEACEAAQKNARARQVAREVHQLPSGRWIVASWSDSHCQWQSSDQDGRSRRPCEGYVYSFARTLTALAGLVRTHATRAGALRAVPPLDPVECAACAEHSDATYRAWLAEPRACRDCGRLTATRDVPVCEDCVDRQWQADEAEDLERAALWA